MLDVTSTDQDDKAWEEEKGRKPGQGCKIPLDSSMERKKNKIKAMPSAFHSESQ